MELSDLVFDGFNSFKKIKIMLQIAEAYFSSSMVSEGGEMLRDTKEKLIKYYGAQHPLLE